MYMSIPGRTILPGEYVIKLLLLRVHVLHNFLDVFSNEIYNNVTSSTTFPRSVYFCTLHLDLFFVVMYAAASTGKVLCTCL